LRISTTKNNNKKETKNIFYRHNHYFELFLIMSLTKTLYQGGTLDVDGLEWAELARGYFPSLDLTPNYTGGDALVALFMCHIFPNPLALHVASYLNVWTKVQEPTPSTYRLTHQIRMYNHNSISVRNQNASEYYQAKALIPWNINYQPLKYWFEQRLQRDYCYRCGEFAAYNMLMRKGTCHHCQLDGRERERIDDLTYIHKYEDLRREWSCVFVDQEEVELLELEVSDC
jgi:hypothetical protein